MLRNLRSKICRRVNEKQKQASINLYFAKQKMEAFRASAILAICSLLLFFLYGSVASVLPHFCPGETSCTYGCCPLPNATCCSDGMQCCPGGSLCLPSRGMCVRSENPVGAVATIRASPVKLKASEDKDSIPCPPNTTSCGPDKCCFFRDATCCEDGLHCCPSDYKCDLSQGQCYRNVNNELTSHLDDDYNGTAVTPMVRSILKSPFQTCTGVPSINGGDLHCPSYTYCCGDEEVSMVFCCWTPFPFMPGHGHITEDNPETDDPLTDYPVTETVW